MSLSHNAMLKESKSKEHLLSDPIHVVLHNRRDEPGGLKSVKAYPRQGTRVTAREETHADIPELVTQLRSVCDIHCTVT
jgi:hypothetical protein